MADESKYPTRIAPYGLRMPDDLKARIQAAAEANNRSMNSEIVATLEEKYPAPVDGFDPTEALQRLRELKTLTQMLLDIPPDSAQYKDVKDYFLLREEELAAILNEAEISQARGG